MTVKSVQLKLITASDTNSCYGRHKSSMQPLISSIMNFHGNSSQQQFFQKHLALYLFYGHCHGTVFRRSQPKTEQYRGNGRGNGGWSSPVCSSLYHLYTCHSIIQFCRLSFLMIFDSTSIHHTKKAKGHPNLLECPFFWYIFGLINWSNYLLPPNEPPPLWLLLREEPPPKELRAPLLPPPKERLPRLNERLLFNELPPR